MFGQSEMFLASTPSDSVWLPIVVLVVAIVTTYAWEVMRSGETP